MNRLMLCALLLQGPVASAQTALERREAILKARQEKNAPEKVAQRVLAGVDERLEAARRAPDDAALVLEATRTLRDALRDSTEATLREAARARVSTVEPLLGQASSAHPEEAPLLLMEKASLLFHAGRKGEVEALMLASMDARPNLDAALALTGLYDRRGERDKVVPLCERTRPQLIREAQVFELLQACMKHSGASTIESGLSWASKGDRDFYVREVKRRAAAPAR